MRTALSPINLGRLLLCWLLPAQVVGLPAAAQEPPAGIRLTWDTLPEMPQDPGVAGPFVGVHRGGLIVAGGANFPLPVWDHDKVWHDRIVVLAEDRGELRWQDAGQLPRPLAYGASVSTPQGVVCLGGNDAQRTWDSVFLLQWDPSDGRVTRTDLPSLPHPLTCGGAARIGSTVYAACGQTGLNLATGTASMWALDLSQPLAASGFAWQPLPDCPGPPRAFPIVVAQHNGFDDAVYVISGRQQDGDTVRFLTDVWEYTPESRRWRQRQDVPQCVMAGTGAPFGQSHLFVLGGADGSRFFQADELRDTHPGFPKQAFAYHTITDTWTSAGATPANHVTTTAVEFQGALVIPGGEIRPRVRTTAVRTVHVAPSPSRFGIVNSTVLVVYLLAMVAVGAWFTFRNRNTNDYFRGGQAIPWWAAGCSIFATMLSSLTYTGLPAKAYAQDWVYAVGNFMIPVVAVVAVWIALPFYRRIDATSAYEYLERRFSRGVRLFGSASFTLFHVFRMAVVMSLTGLALAVATPFTGQQSVLIMGILSIAYCTLGGIEAVIWTDTVQTFVLFGGALVALAMLVTGVDGGAAGFLESAGDAGKFTIANLHMDVTAARIALWVIVLGGIGQNLSSYTADQAVVQRYMTTSDERRAARSIWTNALLTIPATLLFFGIGSALFAWYRSHPERLDPTIATDQIFPLFIAREMPIGLAGLIVAGVFAAAQSTVSTSMNSTATAVVTDFLRPLRICRTERGCLRAARLLTFLSGAAGTALALVFLDPEIYSLFDAFIKVIGLFMGVLGGLFLLGALTRRANAAGALAGAGAGTTVMVAIWLFSAVNGYLYTVCGILTCFVTGYLVSLASGPPPQSLVGLTIHSRHHHHAAKD